MSIHLKKIISFILTITLLGYNITYGNNINSNNNDSISEKINQIKEKNKKKHEKLANILGKADKIIDNYKNKEAKKGTKYLKQNAKNIKNNIINAKNSKLKAIKTANEILKKDLEKKINYEIKNGEINTIQAEIIKKELKPNYLFELQGETSGDIITNDPLFKNQWGINNILNGYTGNKLKYTGEKVTVAVIDTGVDFSVNDLAGKEWKNENCVDSEGVAIPGGCMQGGYDFIDNDTNPYPSDNYTHGTNVSGIIAANTNNNTGISSIANENVEIMSLRTCCGQGNFFGANDISKAIKFAVNNNADIINASFGGPTDSEEIRQAIEFANNAGVTVVAAAGNYSSNNDVTKIYPANYDYENVVSVGSITNNENLSYFSNYGESVDISAPGSSVYSTDFFNKYKVLDGTSFSTPFVTSVLSRYKSQTPNLEVSELSQKLKNSSIQNPRLSGKIYNSLQLKLDESSLEKHFPNPPLPGDETGEENPEDDTTSEPSDGEDGNTNGKVENTLNDSYIKIMEKVSMFRGGKISQEKQKETISLQEIKNLEKELQNFIKSEKNDLLKISGVNEEKISSYISLLESQLKLVSSFNKQVNITSSGTTTLANISTQDFKTLTINTLENLGIEQKEPGEEIKALSDMSSFKFGNDEVNINKIEEYKLIFDIKKLNSESNDNIKFFATENFVPVKLKDLKETSEVIISSEIENLASELENNPVKIFNYVKNNIEYEPYFGVKKTGEQCLRDKSCNDYDTSSLLISLLRASGIPSRYKTSHILVSKKNIEKLLGVSDIKTAFYALSQAKVPVYILKDDSIDETDFESIDFSSVNSLIIEWTFAEMYYDYDHNGANHANDLYLNSIETQEELTTKLEEYQDREWLKIDPSFKSSIISNSQNNTNIVENSTINTNDFFESYLQTGYASGAIEAYKNKIIETSSISDNTELESYYFNKTLEQTNFELLPTSFPYIRVTGTTSSGNTIESSVFSSIPEIAKQKIEIELKKSENSEVVLKKSYKVTDINNIPLDLDYEGFTDADKGIIDNYGSLHLTPSNSVNIRPLLYGSEYNELIGEAITEDIPVKIGDELILNFKYYINGEEVSSSSKYSIAGNKEGIYMNFSKMVPDTMNDDSKILLAGNWAIAKKYLERIEKASDELEKIFNRENTLNYSRAVVTQSRILENIDNSEVKFEFKGLNLDAYSYINDYYRGSEDESLNDYNKYESEFRKIYGLYSSEQEGQIFDDITGLTGISTVKGLQYAYSHPDEYTIHKIDSTNKSIIDSLELSENTKTIMKNYVDEGRTITTPNKLVQNEAWQGLFYTAIDADGEGVYAIGERSMNNGGWTVDGIVYYINGLDTDEGLSEVGQEGPNKEIFIFKQARYSNRLCKIKKDDLLAVFETDKKYEGNEGYSLYGLPCLVKSYQKSSVNGDYTHNVMLGTKGAHFYSQGRIDGYYNNRKIREDKYKFDENIGTYVKEKGFFNKKVEYIYNPINKTLFKTNNEIYLKFKNFHNKLGFPNTNIDEVISGFSDIKGNIQYFENGRIYNYKDKKYATYGKIWERYSKSCTTSTGKDCSAHNSRLGFPTSDIYENSNNAYASDGVKCNNNPDYQFFESNFKDDFYNNKLVNHKIFLPNCEKDISNNLTKRIRKNYSQISKLDYNYNKAILYYSKASGGEEWDYKNNIYADVNTKYKDIYNHKGELLIGSGSSGSDKYININGKYYYHDVPGNINGGITAEPFLSKTQILIGGGCIQKNDNGEGIKSSTCPENGEINKSFVLLNYGVGKMNKLTENKKMFLFFEDGAYPYGDDPRDSYWVGKGYDFGKKILYQNMISILNNN